MFSDAQLIYWKLGTQSNHHWIIYIDFVPTDYKYLTITLADDTTIWTFRGKDFWKQFFPWNGLKIEMLQNSWNRKWGCFRNQVQSQMNHSQMRIIMERASHRSSIYHVVENALAAKIEWQLFAHKTKTKNHSRIVDTYTARVWFRWLDSLK